MNNAHPIVVIIGAPASGKSRVSRALADLLSVKLIDTDAEIEKLYGPIPEIFSAHGENFFREREREIVHDALSQNAIVSLGGGAVMNIDTQQELASLPVVQMTVKNEVAQKRISNNKRPLLEGDISRWESIVISRQPIYDKVSDLTLDSSEIDSEENARTIAQWLQTRNEVVS
jgi:shikimate kinase